MRSSGSGRERIIAAATRLFAELGYDGTSTRMIAEAAGLNIATVAYHAGGKRDLYLAVMERAHQVERAALEDATAGLAAGPAGLHGLVDRYLDFCLDHPEIPALWMHRWLSDAADMTDLENRYVKPLIIQVCETVQRVVDTDADVEYAVMTVIWSTHGFCRGGVLDDDGRRTGPGNPKEVQRFRTHLHRLTTRLLALPE
jgi:AcrR family transcriptional regulator